MEPNAQVEFRRIVEEFEAHVMKGDAVDVREWLERSPGLAQQLAPVFDGIVILARILREAPGRRGDRRKTGD